MTEKEYRRKLKELHVCRDCKKVDAYTLSGRTYCYECAEKGRIRKADARKDPIKNEKMLESKRQQIARYRTEHKCLFCGKPVGENERLCQRCILKSREYNRKHRNSLPRTEGICYKCNKKPVVDGRKLCKECYDKLIPIAMKNLEKTRENHPWKKEFNI